MQFGQLSAQIYLGWIKGCPCTESQCAFEALRYQVQSDNICDAAIDEPQHHSQTDGATAEHHDFVSRTDLGSIHRMQSDGQWFAHGGD